MAEKGLFTPPIRSCHVIFSMRPQYTLSHKIVAQNKPKSPNITCSEAPTWRKQHQHQRLLSSDQRSFSPPPSDFMLEPGKCTGVAVIVVSQPQELEGLLWLMPVTMLFELCQKQVDIKYWKNGEKNVATVYVDGKFIASGSSEKKETTKLNATKQALLKLSESMPTNVGRLDFSFGLNKSFEIDGAKQKLRELCGKKKWPKSIYSLEKDDGPPHDKKYVSSVQIPTVDGILYIEGDEKSRVKEAQNSAASLIIHALQESNYL